MGKSHITNKSQEVSPFPADHKAAINRRESITNTYYRNNANDPQKKYRHVAVSKNILLDSLRLKYNFDFSISFILYCHVPK